jgi:hypothetical protein
VNRRTNLQAREILRAARVCELRRLADDTARTFVDAQRSTPLSGIEIAQQMEQLLDAYRVDYERQAANARDPAQKLEAIEMSNPAVAGGALRQGTVGVACKRRQARPLLLLPSQPHLQRALMRCLVGRGSL